MEIKPINWSGVLLFMGSIADQRPSYSEKLLLSDKQSGWDGHTTPQADKKATEHETQKLLIEKNH